jgi:hypothetical protein
MNTDFVDRKLIIPEQFYLFALSLLTHTLTHYRSGTLLINVIIILSILRARFGRMIFHR